MSESKIFKSSTIWSLNLLTLLQISLHLHPVPTRHSQSLYCNSISPPGLLHVHPSLSSFHSAKYNCLHLYTPNKKRKGNQILLIMPPAQPHKCTAASQSSWMLTFDIPQGKVSIAGSFRGEGEEEAMPGLGLVSVHHTDGVNQLRRINQNKRFRFKWHNL